VLFNQQRVGKNGASFRLFKFRTMRPGNGALITIGNDSRITSIGKFLRRSKFDELPQLFNVLKGEMSLVGPRPEVEFYVNDYTSYQRRVLNIVPGITDLSSLILSNESALLALASNPEQFYSKVLLRQKLRLSAIYSNQPSLPKYFTLLWWTFCALAHIPLPRINRIQKLLESCTFF
jgi:lipopolysaccharide/colanic/teichoic acid biosynthesis glycosyltransferase